MSITDAYPLSTTYRTIAQTTVEEGSIVKPRGYETRELLGVTMAITDLPNSIPIGCGRDLKRLQREPDARQSFVSSWDPAYDQDDTRDLPCTVSFRFHIRDGRLVMHSHMRSQDVFLGLPYDVFFFGQLGMTIARALNLPPRETTLIHHVDSFHAYARNFD